MKPQIQHSILLEFNTLTCKPEFLSNKKQMKQSKNKYMLNRNELLSFRLN
jgi:hypothetical protein